jgi:hypothetical protein
VISDSKTQCLAKSVFQPLVETPGESDAFTADPAADSHLIARHFASPEDAAGAVQAPPPGRR